MPLPWLVPAITGVAGIAQSLIGHAGQKRENMELAQFQAQANERYLDKQLAYNTPANQMARFKEAGLNSHLIYGQGNPGNQSTPLTHPEVRPRDFSQILNMSQMVNQTRMVDSQISAQQSATMKNNAQVELTRLQSLVAQKNPVLNDSAYNAIISSLISTADVKSSEAKIKGQESDWKLRTIEVTNEDGFYKGTNGMRKMEAELDTLVKKYQLQNVDQQIKKEILDGKGFQNDILEVQKRFMTDGDITPQHIITFIQLLLMKLL